MPRTRIVVHEDNMGNIGYALEVPGIICDRCGITERDEDLASFMPWDTDETYCVECAQEMNGIFDRMLRQYMRENNISFAVYDIRQFEDQVREEMELN